jgi:hypothetical protein
VVDWNIFGGFNEFHYILNDGRCCVEGFGLLGARYCLNRFLCNDVGLTVSTDLLHCLCLLIDIDNHSQSILRGASDYFSLIEGWILDSLDEADFTLSNGRIFSGDEVDTGRYIRDRSDNLSHTGRLYDLLSVLVDCLLVDE